MTLIHGLKSRFSSVDTCMFPVFCKEYNYNFTLYDYLTLKYLEAFYTACKNDDADCYIYEGIIFKYFLINEHMKNMIDLIGCKEGDIRNSISILFRQGVLPMPPEISHNYGDNMLYLYIPRRCIRSLYFYEYSCSNENYCIDDMHTNTNLKADSIVGWVYCLYNTDNYLTKIGKSKDVKKRMISLTYSTGSTLKHICSVKVRRYSSFEESMHNYFESSRKSGEWFDLHKSIANDIKHHFELVANEYGYEILEYMEGDI